MHYKVLCVQKLWFFCAFVVQSVQNGGESDESAGCCERGVGLCRSALLLPLAGCCRDVVLALSATPWGRGTRRCSRRSREQRKRRRKPPLSPHCAKRNAARVPRPADFAEVRRMGGSALVRKTRRLARWGRGRGRGKPRCDIEALLQKGLTEYISREALNKSRHTSCLHIFRLIARKLLEIHQVFLRHFHTI